MQTDFVQIYSLLEVSPQKAVKYALAMLEIAESQEEIDSINWARGFALLKLREFGEARRVWLDLYDRTKSHKALHQLGQAELGAGQLETAYRCFLAEYSLVEKGDVLGKAANLYELARCSWLLGHKPDSLQYLETYETLQFKEIDPAERARYFRLKGNILLTSDPAEAKKAFQQSYNFFKEARDESSTLEVQTLLEQL